MAGPNLTGWTASSLTPVAKAVAPPKKRGEDLDDSLQANVDSRATPAMYLQDYKARKQIADRVEAEARASGDPIKLQEALREALFTGAAYNRAMGIDESSGVRRARITKEFGARNPGFDTTTVDFSALTRTRFPGRKPTATEQTGVIDPNRAPVTGGTQTDLSADTRQSDVIGGLAPDYGAQVEGAAGGPSFSGPTSGWTQAPESVSLSGSVLSGDTPTTAFSPPTTPQAPLGFASSSPTDAYNLTPEELGNAGPDPRTPSKPTTPLEQLLRTIYPDAPMSTADPLADPRNPGAGPSGFADVLAYINSQSGSGSGYVPAPAMSAPPAGVPSAGANIASTIPGAPSWLGPQINSLSGGGGGFVQAPPSGGGGMNLAGLAAISAEQRVQQAQLDAALAKQQADYFAQQNAERELAARKAQLERQRGSIAGSGWNQPIYKDGKFFAGELPY